MSFTVAPVETFNKWRRSTFPLLKDEIQMKLEKT